uniref:CCHC-type domain-containing protein n=1 Tax=Mola mola TaxID=94237 RepID=A0A3Q4AVM6_MOLML
MPIAMLLHWCRGEGINAKHAILVICLSENLELGQIEDVLNTMRCWGRLRVQGRKFSSDAAGLFSMGGSSAGKTVADLQGFCTPVPPGLTQETVLQSLADAITKANKGQNENHGYRRLMIFSGIVPTPAGEESMDYWLEQATLMVQESEWTEQEKRRRILECLRGPPRASSKEYLNALDDALGSAESGEDLYFSFRLKQQKPSEKLSDYVQKLEPVLAKLLRGAICSDWIHSPNFLDLLTEIRREEEHERTHQRVNTRVRSKADVHMLASQSFQSGNDRSEAVVLWKKTADCGFSAQKQSFKSDSDRLCYKCGEDGHIASKCLSPENEKKVIKRLIASLNKAKDKRVPDNDSKDETTLCPVTKKAVHAKSTPPFPEGLIGPSSIVQVKVNGHPCTAILDSGSQVTIIFEKWYEKH